MTVDIHPKDHNMGGSIAAVAASEEAEATVATGAVEAAEADGSKTAFFGFPPTR